MKKSVIGITLFLIVFAVVVFVRSNQTNQGILSPLGKMVEKPLDKYTFENLQKREYQPSEITFTANNGFYFYSDGEKVSGSVNYPPNISSTSAFTKPAIIMIRGFATPEQYYPGFGTEKVAAQLAKNGFVTFAPDFLGFGNSDKPSPDAFEDRFLTYTTILNLMSAVKPVGLWGHSNGGQIALSVLEISGKNIPTVLWNPVSITFPYSILYYTWDNDDHGKALRRSLANFEKNYDTEKYSLTNFLGWINAPILLQQGAVDDQVPQKWSDGLAKNLKDKNKNITYKIYPGSDHNMMPLWNQATAESVNFFLNNL